MKAILNRMFVLSSFDRELVDKLNPTLMLDILTFFDEDVVSAPFNPLNKHFVFSLKKNTSKTRKQVAALSHRFSVIAAHYCDSHYSFYLTYDSVAYKLLKTLL